MQHPRKKITRKELKEDKFIIATIKAKEYLDKNSKLIIRGIIGLIIVAVIVIFFVRSKKEANAKAATMLGQAQLMLSSAKQTAVLDSLNLIVDRYDGTIAAGKATFLLGKLNWEKNDFENAKKYFKEFIDDYSDETIVTQAALAGYADCLMQEKNYHESAQYYERAAKINPDYPESPGYFFSAAAAYKEAGEYGKAEELAEKIVNDYQNVQIKNKAEILLESLKYGNL